MRFDACVHGAYPTGVHVPDLLTFPEPLLIVWRGVGALCDYDAVVVWATQTELDCSVAVDWVVGHAEFLWSLLVLS